MIGVDARSGKALGGDAHLAQSIADVLTTPIGSRVLRRDYGSLLPELIDAPFNGATRLRLYAAVALALLRWEPRIRLSRVQIVPRPEPGAFDIDLDVERLDERTDTPFQQLTVPLRLRAA